MCFEVTSCLFFVFVLFFCTTQLVFQNQQALRPRNGSQKSANVGGGQRLVGSSPGGEGGTPFYGLYRYVQPQTECVSAILVINRVWF